LWIANSIFILFPTLGAVPVAKLGMDDEVVLMFLIYFSIVIFIVGLRDFAAVLLGVTIDQNEAPNWMTRSQAVGIVIVYVAMLLAGLAPIYMLDVSDPILALMVYAIAGFLWLLMRYAGSRLSPGSKHDCQGRADLNHCSIGEQGTSPR
jgi:protein-S-isoprenylcysteine O-methyltransferase Ste14